MIYLHQTTKNYIQNKFENYNVKNNVYHAKEYQKYVEAFWIIMCQSNALCVCPISRLDLTLIIIMLVNVQWSPAGIVLMIKLKVLSPGFPSYQWFHINSVDRMT